MWKLTSPKMVRTLAMSLAAIVVGYLHLAAAPRSAVQSSATYEQVLNAVFPSDVTGGASFAVRLQFLPSHSFESQIVIKQDFDKVEATEVVAAGARVWDQLAKLDLGLPVQELSKRIKVQKKTFTVNVAEVRDWHVQLTASLRDTLLQMLGRTQEGERTRSIFLGPDDGTKYRIWYRPNAGETAWEFNDLEVSERIEGDLSAVRWMNMVRLALAKRPSK